MNLKLGTKDRRATVLPSPPSSFSKTRLGRWGEEDSTSTTRSRSMSLDWGLGGQDCRFIDDLCKGGNKEDERRQDVVIIS